MNTTTHYQTSFRVEDSDKEALRKLKSAVYGWVRTKELDRALIKERANFFHRCHWPNLHRSHSAITTESFLSEVGGAWAIHYREMDQREGAKRFWYTDIGFKQEPGTVVVSIQTSYGWNTEYLSQEPEAPEPTVPTVIRYILKDNPAFSGRPEFRLIERPIVFDKVGMGKALCDFVQSPERRYPLIVFNGNGAEVTREAKSLARDLAGKCQIAVIADDPEIQEEVAHFLPGEFAIPTEHLRVFLPFRTKWNSPERHRWYDCRHQGYRSLRHGIVTGLLRHHSLIERGSVDTVEDVRRLITREKLLRLKVQDPAKQSELDEFLKLYEDLEKQRDQFKSDYESAKVDAQAFAEEADRQEQTAKEARFECDTYKNRVRELADRVAEVNVAKLLPTLPESLGDVAEAAKRFCTRLVITDAAMDAAKDFHDCKCVAECWEMLVAMHEYLHPLKFSDGDSKDLERAFKEKSRYELAMSEGKMTKNDSKLMRLRELQHDGREFDITPHLKHGNQEPKLVRIHFAFDEREKKIVIGHIGKHIPNYTTKKL